MSPSKPNNKTTPFQETTLFTCSPYPKEHLSLVSKTRFAAMDMLSISSPLSASIRSVKPTTRSSVSKPFRVSARPRISSISTWRSLSLKTSLNPRCIATSAGPATVPGYEFELPRVEDSIRVTDTQTQQQNAMMNAAVDPMGLLLKERIVFLGYEINDFIADAIISQLLLLDAQDPTKDIRLFINSPGGSMSATMAIFDALQLVRADVSTIAIGIAASTASLILGGGTKGKRLAMPNTRIMIHQPLGGSGGHISQVEIQAREIMKIKDSTIKLVSNFTGRPYDEIEKLLERDRYMSPVEAMEYGILDGVIDRDIVIPLKPSPEQVKASPTKA